MTINWTTIHVKDMEASLAFYHGLLGLPVAGRMGVPGHDQRDWDFATKFGPPEHEIAMLGPQDGTKLELLCGGAPIEGPIGLGVSMGFTPDNMGDLLEKLAAAGYAIPEPMSPNPSLRFFFIKDPDGYTVQLVEQLG